MGCDVVARSGRQYVLEEEKGTCKTEDFRRWNGDLVTQVEGFEGAGKSRQRDGEVRSVPLAEQAQSYDASKGVDPTYTCRDSSQGSGDNETARVVSGRVGGIRKGFHPLMDLWWASV